MYCFNPTHCFRRVSGTRTHFCLEAPSPTLEMSTAWGCHFKLSFRNTALRLFHQLNVDCSVPPDKVAPQRVRTSQFSVDGWRSRLPCFVARLSATRFLRAHGGVIILENPGCCVGAFRLCCCWRLQKLDPRERLLTDFPNVQCTRRRWRSARHETLEELKITDGIPGAWVKRFTFASGPRPVGMCNRLNTCALCRFNGRRVALHQTNKTGRRMVRTCHRRFAFALPHVSAVTVGTAGQGTQGFRQQPVQHKIRLDSSQNRRQRERRRLHKKNREHTSWRKCEHRFRTAGRPGKHSVHWHRAKRFGHPHVPA